MSFENLVKSCQSVMHDYADVEVPYTDMEQIVKTYGLEDLTEWYTFDKPTPYFDTMDRENVMEAFAKFIGAESWPTYGEAGSDLEKDFEIKLENYKGKVK